MSPMLARVADNLYWIARAIERADTYERLLEVSHAMTRESGDVSYGARTVWEPLVEITGDMERFEQLFHVADEESVVQFLATSPDNPNSITSCLRRARQNAQSVRDLLPTDVWEALNTVYLELAEAETGNDDRERVYLLSRQVRRAVALLHGLIDGGMRRDGSWYFLRLGEVGAAARGEVPPAASGRCCAHRWRRAASVAQSAALRRGRRGFTPIGRRPRVAAARASAASKASRPTNAR